MPIGSLQADKLCNFSPTANVFTAILRNLKTER